MHGFNSHEFPPIEVTANLIRLIYNIGARNRYKKKKQPGNVASCFRNCEFGNLKQLLLYNSILLHKRCAAITTCIAIAIIQLSQSAIAIELYVKYRTD